VFLAHNPISPNVDMHGCACTHHSAKSVQAVWVNQADVTKHLVHTRNNQLGQSPTSSVIETQTSQKVLFSVRTVRIMEIRWVEIVGGRLALFINLAPVMC